MRDFLYRIRLAWAVLRGNYKWLAECEQLWFCYRIVSARIDNMQIPEEEGEVRASAATIPLVSSRLPFILVWKNTSGQFLSSYVGTEEELNELKEQEIIID